MSFALTYSLFWFLFLCILFVFNKYKLYLREKWKVTISIFIGLNALFTGFVLYQQNMIHREEVIEKLSSKYDTLSDEIFYKPLDFIIKTPKLNYLVKKLYFRYDIDTKEFTHHDEDNYLEIAPVELGLFLQICQTISVYSQYYYLHLELPNFYDLVKTQNIRFFNILTNYLNYPPFKKVVQQYVDYQAGLRSQLYLKEFFNITNNNPSDEKEKAIANNKIIDGKINGITSII